MVQRLSFVLHLHIVFVSFSYRFQPSTRKRSKRLKKVKTSGKLLFAFQENLNNLWFIIITILLSNLPTLETVFTSYHFQVIAFDRFSVGCRVKTQRKVCSFDENEMKTYSCRRSLRISRVNCRLRVDTY